MNLSTHQDLAQKFQLKQSKMNLLLKGLYDELVTNMMDYPIVIPRHIHILNIHVPYDEYQEMSKEKKSEVNKESTFIQLVLPVTPSIGEEISLPFIEQTGKYYRGYVHEVHHTIKGDIQEIYIEVHPYRHYYFKWVKLKNDYERTIAWLRSLRDK